MAGQASGEVSTRHFTASCQLPGSGLYKRYGLVSVWLALCTRLVKLVLKGGRSRNRPLPDPGACNAPHPRAGTGPAMTDNLSIDRRTSALLVMDFQTLIVDNYAAGAEALLDRTSKLIAAARTAGMRVIYVVVGFRAGYPEVSERNATFNGLKVSGAFAAGAKCEDPSRRRAAGRGTRRHQASGERLRRDRSRPDAARQRHRDPDPDGDRHQRRRALDPAPCRRRGLQTAGRRRLLLGQRRGSASGAIGEGLSAAGHHHDGGGTRAGHRGWAIDAVTAPYPSHRQALSLSSTERSRACRFREYDIFRSGTGLAVSVPSFVSTILLARSLKGD